MGRLEDKEVRRVSRKVKLDPMIDEDSVDEDYDFLLEGATKPFPTFQAEQTRLLGTPDIHSPTGDTETTFTSTIKGSITSATTAPTSLGSALRKNADGSIAAPKVLSKRNKGQKVGRTPLYLTIG